MKSLVIALLDIRHQCASE